MLHYGSKAKYTKPTTTNYIMQITTSFPYTDSKTGVRYNRLIVKQDPKPDVLSDANMLIPSQVLNNICESGIVISVSAGSKLKPGDAIVYAKVNRNEKEQYDAVLIDNEEYDVLYENEVWSVNEKPWNRLFVTPLSDINVGDSGVIAPTTAKGIPQEGVIHLAPEGSPFKSGDIIQYRKQEQSIFATVNLDGVNYDVLWETDVFTVNGKCAPARMIVKIDMRSQYLKRQVSDEGVALSPLFQFMKRNLQWGKLCEIGEEAQSHYPELAVGDIVILHHIIESQDYRLLKVKQAKISRMVTAEYRMINSFDPNSREVFGVIKGTIDDDGKLKYGKIIPFGKNIFLKWKFSLVERPERMSSTVLDYDFSIAECTDFDELHSTIEKKRQEGINRYKLKYSAHVMQLEKLNPALEETQDTIKYFQSSIEQMKGDVARVTSYIQKNHLVQCHIAFPPTIPATIALPYKELYPIELFGEKYLIANNDYIFFTISKDIATMQQVFTPFRERVLIKSIEKEIDETTIIGPSSTEKPQKAKVIKIGEKVDLCQEGSIVLHRKNVGYPVELDGVEYLVINQNDLLGEVIED